ncbi:MAG: hypothetical protein EOS75_23385 [Mesorhizobium sp.]|nr:MAG: hypothetical protein EOS75_23385 [Mesorhizobium sp.]
MSSFRICEASWTKSVATELKAACERLQSLSETSGTILPRIPIVSEVADRLRNLPQANYKPGKVDLNATARKIRDASASGLTLTRKQLRDAAWCLWSTQPALAEAGDVLGVLLREWEVADKPRFFRSLASAFLQSYAKDQVARDQVARSLQSLSSRWPGPWSDIHKRFAIFDLERGPVELALEVVSSGRSPVEIFRDFALGDIVAHGGLTEAVVAALLRDLAYESDHERRLELVEKYALKNGKVAFHGQGPAIVEALLRPFVNKGADLNVQDQFLALIVKAFDDPRLRPTNWVSLPHKDLVLGWLTRQSLRQFLDVVDATTVDFDAKRMWKYRRAFWEGMYNFYRKEGFSVETWVAFGAQGQREAKRIFGNAGFATLSTDGKPVSSDHAVLLFKVADCVIADWNHNGKCHIWSSARQQSAPTFYNRNYGSNDVQIFVGQGHHETSTELTWGHGGSDTYSWQRKLADRLAKIVGKRVPESAFKVGR